MTDKEKLKEIKKLADAMYHTAFNLTTDASLLRKAMDDYHQFIIYKYYKKEPISEDLEDAANNELERILDKYGLVGTGSCLEMFKLGAKWRKEHFWKPSDEMLEALYRVIPENVMEKSEDEMLLDKLYQGLKYGKVLSEK